MMIYCFTPMPTGFQVNISRYRLFYLDDNLGTYILYYPLLSKVEKKLPQKHQDTERNLWLRYKLFGVFQPETLNPEPLNLDIKYLYSS